MKAVQNFPQKLKKDKLFGIIHTQAVLSAVTCTVQMVIELIDQRSMMIHPKCEIIQRFFNLMVLRN